MTLLFPPLCYRRRSSGALPTLPRASLPLRPWGEETDPRLSRMPGIRPTTWGCSTTRYERLFVWDILLQNMVMNCYCRSEVMMMKCIFVCLFSFQDAAQSLKASMRNGGNVSCWWNWKWTHSHKNINGVGSVWFSLLNEAYTHCCVNGARVREPKIASRILH